jgi:hypothetical protein
MDFLDGSGFWDSAAGGGGGGPSEPTGKLTLIDRADLLRTITMLVIALFF